MRNSRSGVAAYVDAPGGHWSDPANREGMWGGLAVPFENITPFSPSMTRAGLARRLRRSSIIDGCAAA